MRALLLRLVAARGPMRFTLRVPAPRLEGQCQLVAYARTCARWSAAHQPTSRMAWWTYINILDIVLANGV
jgi:hypothetical protein